MSYRLALVDCNNFFCSCERVFDPSLINVPVVILSNNDGCIISRSDEAKVLGIPMGAPLHEQQEIIRKHKVRVLSGNFTLYNDMSGRVMSILRDEVPKIEVYSIDEAFLQLPDSFQEKEARALRAKVLQWTGIPVCIGIGTTKLLAKLSNHYAKQNKASTGGIFDITIHRDSERIMAEFSCDVLWCVAENTVESLSVLDIKTVLEFKQANPLFVRKILGVIGERMQMELNGIPCMKIEELPPSRKGVMASRSFGSPVESLEELGEALANHVAHAAEKIRSFGLLATHLEVFLRTNRFRKDIPQCCPVKGILLNNPTSSTSELMTVARQLLESIYRRGYYYKKTGVMLKGLVRVDSYQPCLFDASPHSDIDRIVDSVNQKLRNSKDAAVTRLAQGSIHSGLRWKMKSINRSPNYTTNWNELLIVKI